LRHGDLAKRDGQTYLPVVWKERNYSKSIDIKPETERVVRKALRQGQFRSADELILSSVQAWRERQQLRTIVATQLQPGASTDGTRQENSCGGRKAIPIHRRFPMKPSAAPA